MSPGRRSSVWWLLVALAVLYGQRLALVSDLGATGVGLHVDEAQYWHWSRRLEWGYFSKPPGIAALIRLSTEAFGNSLIGVKALAMVCYPLAALLLGRLASEMVEAHGAQARRFAGGVAALLFVTTPLAGLLGLAATTDAPLLLAWTLSLWALWRAVHTPPSGSFTGRWLLFGAAVGLGMMSKYTMGVIVFPALASLWIHRNALHATAHLRGALAAAALALVMVWPNLLWNQAHSWPTLRHTAEITLGANPRVSALASLGEFAAGQILMLGPVLALVMVVCLVWPDRAHVTQEKRTTTTSTDGRRFALWSAGPMLAIGSAQALHTHAQINWTAPAICGLVLWTAIALTDRRRRGDRWPGWATGLCAVSGVALSLTVALAPALAEAVEQPLPRSVDVWSRMRGWDDALLSLRPKAAGRPGATVIGADRAVIAHGAYAWRDLPLQWTAMPHDGPARHHYELTAQLPPLGGSRGSILLLGYGPPDAVTLERYPGSRWLASAAAPVSPGQSLSLQLWEAEP